MSSLKHKYFCDKCTKSRYGEITFTSFEKNRDYTLHMERTKHSHNCELIEKDENSILCLECNEKFSVEGFKVHKKRNERLWTLKKHIGNNYLKCNRFQWEECGRLFSSMEKLINFRNNPIVSQVSSKHTKTFIDSYSQESLTRSPKLIGKSVEEKKAIIEKEEAEWVDMSQRPILPMCNLCNGYENEDKIYKDSHLLKWDMRICDCEEED